jgi:hypothetical protein
VRFSSSPWVNEEHDLVLLPPRLAILPRDEQLVWGIAEGDGAEIRMTWPRYFA